MKRFLSLVLALCSAAGMASAKELLSGGSFEAPKVTERTPAHKGGDPRNDSSSKIPDWDAFEHVPDAKDGTVIAGLTKEIAHSGAQSFYIEFTKVAAPQRGARIQTRLIPIAPSSQYRVSIWGRLDAKNPITTGAKHRAAILKVQVDFFSKDGSEPVGESEYASQAIPGSKDRGVMFTPDKWTEFSTEVATPEDAGFLQVTWRWASGPGEGETNGVLFFDDASIAGPPAANPNATPAPVKEEQEASPAEPGMTSEEPSTPAASPNPAGSPSSSAEKPSAPAAPAAPRVSPPGR